VTLSAACASAAFRPSSAVQKTAISPCRIRCLSPFREAAHPPSNAKTSSRPLKKFHAPSDGQPKERKYQPNPDDVELKVRLSKHTFDALNAMKDPDRSAEAYVRRMIKEEVKRWRKAESLRFVINNQAAIEKLINKDREELPRRRHDAAVAFLADEPSGIESQ
jgi:hypothetical protein